MNEAESTIEVQAEIIVRLRREKTSLEKTVDRLQRTLDQVREEQEREKAQAQAREQEG